MPQRLAELLETARCAHRLRQVLEQGKRVDARIVFLQHDVATGSADRGSDVSAVVCQCLTCGDLNEYGWEPTHIAEYGGHSRVGRVGTMEVRGG